jgi:hypothetical protein
MTSSESHATEERNADKPRESGFSCPAKNRYGPNESSDGSNRNEDAKKFTKMDVAYLRLNTIACFRSTRVLLGQIQQYVVAISEDLDSISPNGNEPAGNDLLTRFRMAQMRCRSQQMLYELDIFHDSVTGFIRAESVVRKTIERRETFAADQDMKSCMGRSRVEEIERGRKYG